MAARKSGKPSGRSALAQAVSGSQMQGQREPMFDLGPATATFLSLEATPVIAGKDPYLKALFDGGEDVGVRAQLYCVGNRSLAATGPKLKSLAGALIGVFSDAEFDEWEAAQSESGQADGGFLDALTGIQNEFSELVAGDIAGKAVVNMNVTSEGETVDGQDFYRRLNFLPGEAVAEEPEPAPAPRAPKKAGKR